MRFQYLIPALIVVAIVGGLLLTLFTYFNENNSGESLMTNSIGGSHSHLSQEITLKDSFSDFMISENEAYSLSSGNGIYYVYLKNTLNGNGPLKLLAGGEFVRETLGFRVSGGPLEFAPLPCSSALESDFNPANGFGASGAIEISQLSNICVKNKDSKFDLTLTSLSEDSVVFE